MIGRRSNLSELLAVSTKLTMLLTVVNVLIFSGCLLQPSASAFTTRDRLMDLIQSYLQEVDRVDDAMEESGTVQIMDASTRNRIEGTYVGNDGDGIVFVSEDDGTGNGKLRISTLQGETIFQAINQQGLHGASTSLVTVGNEVMLVQNGNQFGKNDVSVSRVPLTHMSMAETAVEESNTFVIDLLRGNLERMSEDEALAQLNRIQDDSEYAKIIVAAAHSIASSGITGVDHLGARLFFSHAKNLAGTLQSVPAESNIATYVVKTAAAEECTQYPTTCPVGECPFKTSGNDCRGMCGPQCYCWKFICGDCCVHKGCEEHDECCNGSDFFGLLRCFVPIGISCSEGYFC